MRPHLPAVAALAAATLVLTACATAQQPSPARTPDAAGAFVACLKAAGVESRISESTSLVMIRDGAGLTATTPGTSVEISSESTGDGVLMMESGEDGSWIAVADSSAIVEDATTHDAYAGCEAEHPDFRQTSVAPADDPAMREALAQQQEDSLAFARCARDAGFAWVADPTADGGGGILLPADLTEVEFRALLAACDHGDAVAWQVEGELGFDLSAVLDDVAGVDVSVGGNTP
ncbi:hypothetical protein [Microbacterium sp.]|uniref:hypothetical protein n=1 Tax=Microbacterium sp. TaxID=51671 RepID=UPI0039E30785